MLQRDSGPSGWTDSLTGRYELEGWEVFEGDPDSRHTCRGWFRCTADDFITPSGTALTLQLTRADGTARLSDVEIVRAKTTEPEGSSSPPARSCRAAGVGTWDTTRPSRHTTSPCPA